MNVRVLVVDDSVVFRRLITQALASLPDVEVVGRVPNGRLALERVRDLRPDLLTLDLEMPEVDGLGVLDALRKNGDRVATIVVSAHTVQGGRLTVRALEKGAFDFITKPDLPDPDRNLEAFRQELAPRVRALGQRLAVRAADRSAPRGAAAAPGDDKNALARRTRVEGLSALATRMDRLAKPGRPDMVLIGVSTGGPCALARLLPSLPGDLGVPVLIVQHMPPIFTQSLAESLAGKCALRVREAVNGEEALPNNVYIAPGGKQMRMAAGPDGGKLIQITDDPPENNCRPSVDYLFRSAAHHFPGRAVGVILTGMGSDGTLGLRLLKRHGCQVIAQDEDTCVVYGMPKAAVDAGVTDAVLPLDAIAPRISRIVRGGLA